LRGVASRGGEAMRALIFVARVRGVPIFVHWSVPAIALFIAGAGVHILGTAVAVILAYLGMLLIHELGHQLVARAKGCHVLAIELYPLHGLCRFTEPFDAFDDALIAWGGVLAQFVVAIPFAIYATWFGFTSVAPVSVVIAIFGAFSPAIALLNLIPIKPLDGAKAWTLVPILWRRARRPRRPRAKSPQEVFDEAVRNARRR
jgi:stage IV sporulation protein FB